MPFTVSPPRLCLLWPLLALAACRGGEGGDSSNQAGGDMANAAAPATADAQAELQLRAVEALRPLMPGIETARFANLRAGAGRAICGQISLRGPDGAYPPPRPFVVTPEGAAAVSATPTVGWNDPRDPFPEPYGIWCASPEELQAIQSRPDGFIPPPGDVPIDLPPDNGATPPAEPDLDQAPEPTVEPTPPPAPRPLRPVPPRDPNDDSFFNVVLPPD